MTLFGMIRTKPQVCIRLSGRYAGLSGDYDTAQEALAHILLRLTSEESKYEPNSGTDADHCHECSGKSPLPNFGSDDAAWHDCLLGCAAVCMAKAIAHEHQSDTAGDDRVCRNCDGQRAYKQQQAHQSHPGEPLCCHEAGKAVPGFCKWCGHRHTRDSCAYSAGCADGNDESNSFYVATRGNSA